MIKWILWITCFFSSLNAHYSFVELLYPRWGQIFKLDEILLDVEGDWQRIFIFENEHWGRVLSLDDISCYLATVPTYLGGFRAIGWACDDPSLREVTIEELEKRLKHVNGKMKYYTPALHKASFALPKYIYNLIKN